MRIGWLSTGKDAAARDLLVEVVRRARRDRIELDVAVVFCDRERGESEQSDLFLDLVDELGLATATLSSAASWRDWRELPRDKYAHKSAWREAWRASYHDQVMALLGPCEVDLLVLAGYMLIVSPAMCERYAMINLHPALPGGPTGTWQQVIWELLRDDARETGAMMHLVTSDLDRGPVIAYCSFPIVGPRYDADWIQYRRKRERLGWEGVSAAEGETEPLFAAVRRAGARREIPLLCQTVRQFVGGRLLAARGTVTAVDEVLPVDLTRLVEEQVREGS